MKLCEFLEFNQQCPICDSKLTLYMQIIDNLCLKEDLSKSEDKSYYFTPLNGKNKKELADEYVKLKITNNNYNLLCSSSKLFLEMRKSQIYFFYLCNEAGLKKQKYNENDYYISPYYGCYFRSTPIAELHNQENVFPLESGLPLKTINPDHKNIVNINETLVFNSYCQPLEKVYALNLNADIQQTEFSYYAVTDEDKLKENFKPNIFDSKMPLLTVRPKFDKEHRDQLLNRFESWIILS